MYDMYGARCFTFTVGHQQIRHSNLQTLSSSDFVLVDQLPRKYRCLEVFEQNKFSLRLSPVDRHSGGMNFTGVISIIFGLTAGMLSAIVITKYQTIDSNKHASPPELPARPTTKAGAQSIYFMLPGTTNGISVQKLPAGSLAAVVNSDSKRGLFDPRLNSTFLYDKVKILCFVILLQDQIGNYGKAAKATWTKHCNKVIFLSSKINANIGTIDIKLPEGKSDSWLRSKLALQYVHENFKDGEYDWFVKAGHDSVLVAENMRYLLLLHMANIPNYIGHVFSGPKSGGSVFAVNKQGLGLIVPKLDDFMPSFGGVADDLELGECFKKAGAISSSQGLDSEGVQRFRMIVPDHKLPLNTEGYTAWYWQYIRYPEKEVSM